MSKQPSVVRDLRVDRLATDVIEGLRKSPKELSSVWFYDERGSDLFDQICELPEYYLTRTELGIMEMHAAEMAQLIGPQAALIEYGSGTSRKTRLLLDRLIAPAAYVPVDVAKEHLLDAAGSLAPAYPSLQIIPLHADFTQRFELPKSVEAAERRIVYFPGSTLGNFCSDAARTLLSGMREIIGANGAVLIGFDMKKDARILERAYNDSAGITAEFNLNALRHLNRELGSNFDVEAFEHRAVWIEERSRIEMHLLSRQDQTVDIAGTRIAIRSGEFIRTEYCHKYTLESFADLAASAHLLATRTWSDAGKKFSVQLLEPAPIQ